MTVSRKINSGAYRGQVLCRIFQIMDIVGGRGPELGFAELAGRIGRGLLNNWRLKQLTLESLREKSCCSWVKFQAAI